MSTTKEICRGCGSDDPTVERCDYCEMPDYHTMCLTCADPDGFHAQVCMQYAYNRPHEMHQHNYEFTDFQGNTSYGCFTCPGVTLDGRQR